MRNVILIITLLAGVSALGTAHATDTIRVSGQVQNPGRYAWYPGMTVVDAIQAANGLARANGHHIEIVHPDKSRTIFNGDTFNYNEETPPAVNAGDSIDVPANWTNYRYHYKRVINVFAERTPAPSTHTAPKEH